MYQGSTHDALQGAVQSRNTNTISLFFDNGAKIDEQKDNWTPLQMAAYDGHKEIVQLLPDRGADISARSENPIFTRYFLHTWGLT